MNRRRALVTGATGFVGRHLTRHLLNTGWQVDAIVRPSSNRAPLADLSAVHIHQHTGTAASMQAIVEKAKPDIVFHLASLFLSEHQADDVERLVQSNLLFGTQLVEAMTQTGVTKLVNTGTAWQHFQGQDYSPVNLYAATKQAFETLLQYYVEARGLRVITLKLHDTYGPDDPRPKLIQLLRRIATENHPLGMSPGEQLIDLVHIDDVVTAFQVASERLMNEQGNPHERYSVSSGLPLTLRQLVKEVEQILGRALPINWGARPYRQRETMHLWTGQALPGWEPATDLRSGLANILRGRSAPHA
jgi:nucleoside-diphosphate-sugar epimerase